MNLNNYKLQGLYDCKSSKDLGQNSVNIKRDF